MSKFNEYAQELNRIAKTYIADLKNATSASADAEMKYNRHKRPNGLWSNPTLEEIEMATTSEAEYYRTREQLKKVQTTMLSEAKNSIKELRAKLEEALNSHYCATPADIDANLMAILDSGMLSAGEYERLYEKMVQADNATMARMICVAAKEAAEEMGENLAVGSKEREERMRLILISQNAKNIGAGPYLRAFDEMIDMFNIHSRNVALCDRWDEFAGEKIKNF